MNVYHFWSASCEPCKRMKPVFDELKQDFPTLSWVSIDIRNDPQGLTQKFNVKTVPSLVVNNVLQSGTDAPSYYRLLKNAS